MKHYILEFFKKYMELILVLLTIVFVFAKSDFPKYGERISLLFFGTLAFFYLSSGVLVFLDRHRVVRTMRIIYLLGLWGVSTATIGIMARIHLIQMNTELLYIALLGMAACMGFAWLAYRQVEGDENKAAWRWQLKPIVLRCGIVLILGVGILVATPNTVYHTFGTYRDDPTYVEAAVYSYEHPEDTAAQRILEEKTLKKTGKAAPKSD